MRPKLSATRTINASSAAVWEVLADFGNIADWTDQVRTSYRTGAAIAGPGARRHCDLSPVGQLEESIIGFIPEQRLDISIDSATGLPIKTSISTFELREIDADTTEVVMTADPQLKGGPVAPLLRTMLSSRLTRGLAALLDDLAVAAEARTARV